MTNLDEITTTFKRIQKTELIDRTLKHYLRELMTDKWLVATHLYCTDKIEISVWKTETGSDRGICAEFRITAENNVEIISAGAHSDVIDELKTHIEAWLKNECEVKYD